MDKYNPEFDLTKYDKSRQPKTLSIEQQNAIDLLITGKSDGETARLVGVARQTVWNWRNNDTLFYTELNEQTPTGPVVGQPGQDTLAGDRRIGCGRRRPATDG